MRPIILVLFLTACFASCKNEIRPQDLETAFLESLRQNNFELLQGYLPDSKFYKSLGDKMPVRTDEQIKEFLTESNDRVKVAWQNTLQNAIDKKIDLQKVKIREVLIYDPFPQDEQSEAMVIGYEYDGKPWDDLQFIISRHPGKTYLLVIPNPTRAFSMADPELRATNEAKTWLEVHKPEFKKSLEEQVDKIILQVRNNDLPAFAQNLVYRGHDESRMWRTPLNVQDSTEMEMGAEFMKRVSRSIKDCSQYEAGAIRTERESEGTWIVLPVKCTDNRIIQFAFLRVEARLLLGDIDVDRE